MSLPEAARQPLYARFRELGQQITQKNNARIDAARELNRMDNVIAELIAERQQIVDHALSSGEDFEAVERENYYMQQMGREEYDPMGA